MPTIYVDAANEGGTFEDGSQDNPYGTIQEGINACSNGDVVDIAAGTYNENVTLSKSSVTLLGKLDAYDQPTVILEPTLVSLTWTLDETYGPCV
jgi:pectin methylesterase-like acyl-CoA thioesterase